MRTSCFPDFRLIACFLLLLAASPLLGQDDRAGGDFLISQGLFDEAITSYLRSLYFEPGAADESAVCLKIARAYLELGDRGGVVRYADLAVSKAKDESERRACLLERAELLLALGRYAQALQSLDALAALGLAPPEQLRERFLRGVAMVYLRRWDEAYAWLAGYFAETESYPPDTESKALKLLSFARQGSWLDPAAARVLSYLLPGSGQMYAGDFLQGLNSLVVTGLAGALAVWAVATGDYPDALAAAFFVFLRFYLGSPFHAERIARERNEARARAITRGVFDLLTR